MGATTVGHSFGSVDQANRVQIITLNGNYTDYSYFDYYYCGMRFSQASPPPSEYPYDLATSYTGYLYSPSAPGALSCAMDGVAHGNSYDGPKADCDTTYYYRAFEYYGNSADERLGPHAGGTLSLKAYAIDVTFGTPSASNPGIHTMDVSCNWVPGTNESTASAVWQYRKTGASTWVDSAVTQSSQSGYGTKTCSGTVTGLDGGTSYQFRLHVTRTTTNTTDYASSTATNSTLPDVPSLTTNTASPVGVDNATLNSTVDPNTFSTDVTFQWYKSGDAAWGNETSPPSTETGDGDRSVAKTISGLLANTLYYFRVKGVYSGGTVYGGSLSFTTQQDPGVLARSQEMLPIQDFDRKYGVATTIFFTVPQIASGSSDQFYASGAVWSAAGGEVKITKVTYNNSKTPTVTGPANATNDPAQVSGMMYRLDLEAAEMQADEIFITLTNTGVAVRDILLRVRTNLQLASMELDCATGSKANSTALKATGYGSGSGILATAGATGYGASFVGATPFFDIDGVLARHCLRSGVAQAGATSVQIVLDASASASTDYYANAVVAIVSGTAIGQSRTIVSYDGTSKKATVNRAWVTVPDGCDYVILPAYETWQMTPAAAELQTFPTANSNFGLLMQFLFQRFAFKRTQTVSTFSMFKADNTNTIGTGSVADDGSTQTAGKMA